MNNVIQIKKLMPEEKPEAPPVIQTFIPPSLALRVQDLVKAERARLIAALSKIEVPAVSDNKTGKVLEFPGFRPFLDDIINAIKSLDDVDNNW